MAKIICIIGYRGTGKTNYIKTQILPNVKNYLIYDLYGEYKELKYINNIKENGRLQSDFEHLKANITQIRNKNFVFEDSTIFLNANLGRDIKNILVSARHYNNNLFFLFHSLSRLPNFLIEQTDYFVIFKTQEKADNLQKKYPESIIKTFKNVQNAKNKHYFEITKF